MSKRIAKDNSKMFSRRLKQRMLEKDMTQETLAELTGLKRQTISLYQRGENVPAADSLAMIAKALECSTDWLLGLTDYTQKDIEETTLKSVGLSEKAAIALHCDSSVSTALNLLFETEAFREFLKTLWRFFHACEADLIAYRIIEELMMEHNTVNPDNEEISKKLVERSNDNVLDNETQNFLMCLSDRYEKATGGAIYCPQEVENVFGDALRLGDLYEYIAQRLFFSLLDELRKKHD